MRLALLAPIAQSIPPRYDGPRERQIALLCSGLVRQGVDVTLFASGDSMTTGQLAAVCPAAWTADPSLAVWVGDEVERAPTFGFVDLAAIPDQVAQVGTLIPGYDGSAVRLGTLTDVESCNVETDIL